MCRSRRPGHAMLARRSRRPSTMPLAAPAAPARAACSCLRATACRRRMHQARRPSMAARSAQVRAGGTLFADASQVRRHDRRVRRAAKAPIKVGGLQVLPWSGLRGSSRAEACDCPANRAPPPCEPTGLEGYDMPSDGCCARSWRTMGKCTSRTPRPRSPPRRGSAAVEAADGRARTRSARADPTKAQPEKANVTQLRALGACVSGEAPADRTSTGPVSTPVDRRPIERETLVVTSVFFRWQVKNDSMRAGRLHNVPRWTHPSWLKLRGALWQLRHLGRRPSPRPRTW